MVQKLPLTVTGGPFASVCLKRGTTQSTYATLFTEPSRDGATQTTMKVGTYAMSVVKPDFRQPVYEQAKCEVKLRPAEFEAFVAFLEQKLGPLKVRAERYVAVEDAESGEILDALAARLRGREGQALVEAMLERGLLPDDLVAAALHRERAAAIEEAERMLNEDLPERDWQAWLQANDWVLGSAHVAVLDDRRIDLANVADYLLEAEDRHLDVVEIKRPSLGFWAAQRDHGNLYPHADLTKAIVQAQAYLLRLEGEMDSKKTSDRYGGCPIACPRATLIHGRSATWGDDELHAQRLLNGGFSRLQVFTYDQVLKRAGRVLLRASA